MKIAVFGGAFNPVHRGHIQLANEFSKRIGCDKLLMIPSKISPHKSNSQLVSQTHRLNMCRLCERYIQNCEVCEIELNRNDVSYTYETLLELKKQYNNAKIYLICGSDMFLTLQSWKNPQIIFENAIICANKRANEPQENMELQKHLLELAGAEVLLENFFVEPFSSTQTRSLIAASKPFEQTVLPPVAEYIKTNKLYGFGV